MNTDTQLHNNRHTTDTMTTTQQQTHNRHNDNYTTTDTTTDTLQLVSKLNRKKKVNKTASKNKKKNKDVIRQSRLDANFISRPAASSFKGLTSLRHLWLDDNRLTEVPVLALSSLTQLHALTLALNNISSVPDRAFSALSQLLVLHLHDNRIHSLGRRSFTGLKQLETLDLSFNRINRFPAAIRSLSSLRDLNLQNNNILVVPEDAFTGNPSLQTINIQNNPLHAVGPSSLQLLPELRTLSLRGSSITELTDVTGTNPLETLVSELQVNFCCCVFLHCVQSLTLEDTEDTEDTEDSSSLSTCCLDSLHFIFIVSVVFNLLVLLSTLLLPSAPAPPPSSSSSPRLPSVLFWLRLLAGLCGSGLVQDPGPGLFLSSLLSEVCVFVMVGAVVGGNTRTRSCLQISCVVCCSIALTLVVMETGLWTHSSALVLFNTFCFLFMVLTHIPRPPRPPRLPPQDPVSLTVLTHSLLCSSASLLPLLSPDVSTCAELVLWSLSCCVDPLIHLVLAPRLSESL